MKLAVFSFLLLTVSCGKYEVTKDGMGKLGQKLTQVSPTEMSSSDQAKIAAVCSSLATKEANIGSFLNNASLTFNAFQEDCQGLKEAGPVKVSIQGTFLVREDGKAFMFPNVETETQGVFSEICSVIKAGSQISNPTFSNNIFSVVELSSTCPSKTGEICLQVTKANSERVIQSEEIIRVRIDAQTEPNKVGLFTYRKKVASQLCSQGKFQTQEATLSL